MAAVDEPVAVPIEEFQGRCVCSIRRLPLVHEMVTIRLQGEGSERGEFCSILQQ